ncbi:hypothetical protein [Pseudomonas sp.]|uniref:hypothetical protein n=1 Tax=Pseudomonas sp. TaxID=306 RepID=UPI0025842050|nr:hypothetical protein [Pseudomonas sp.]
MRVNIEALIQESSEDDDILSSTIDSLVIEQTKSNSPDEIIQSILEETANTEPGPTAQIRSFRNPNDLIKMIELIAANTCYDPLQGTTSTAELSQLAKLALALILKGMANNELAEVILETHAEVTDPSVRSKALRKLYKS